MVRQASITTGPLGRRRLMVATGASGAAAAFLAACGGGDSKKDAGGAVQEATVISSTPAAAQPGTPKPGGTMSLRMSGNAPLDPYANSTFLTQSLAGFVMSRLLRFKTDLDVAV